MNVFIGCGSADINKINEVYVKETKKIAGYLADNNYDLLCGGTDGLMGVVRNTFLEKNRGVTTIWVDGYFDDNKASVFNSISVPYVKERKSFLLKNADLAVILPGAYGTYDEINTIIESRRANEHNVPIVLLNINNYYEGIILQYKITERENFGFGHPFENSEDKFDLFYIANNLEEAIGHIEDLNIKRKIRR